MAFTLQESRSVFFFEIGVVPRFQRKTKGQQLKGKIVSALFHTFWQFSTHFHTFSGFISEFFLHDFFLELRGFIAVLVKKNKKRE